MPQPVKKQRLDILLTEFGHASSRSRARDMVARGCVRVNDHVVLKAGTTFLRDVRIHVDDPTQKYVSRAALKLVAGLDAGGIDVSDQYCLDLGSSTGGFTEVLLERGARHIFALDVGHGQMVEHISTHSRVTNLEKFNARDLIRETFPQLPKIVVSDMSFISLRIGAAPALHLAVDDASCVLLVKPQFEVGRDGISKGGLVTDKALVDKTLDEIKIWFESLPGWSITHFLPAPLTGGDGNQEYLLCGTRHV